MVSMTDLSAMHGSDASAKRLKQRRAAEWRLKAYGIAAIAVAGLALVALMWSVVGKAGLALSEATATIEVEIPADRVDLDTSASDMRRVVSKALYTRFPSIKGRTPKKELRDVLSGDAPFELYAAIHADPSLIGQTSRLTFLLSDDADLYLKGQFGRLATLGADGELSPVGTGGEVRLLSSANDFAAQLAAVKEGLLEQAGQLRRQAARQENGRAVRRAQAAEAADEETREKLLAEADGYATQRDRLIARADDLEARAARPGGEEPLDETTPSILVEINGGWVKATRVGNDHIIGTAIIPLTSEAAAKPGDWALHVMETPEDSRKITDKQVIAIEELRKDGAIETHFNTRFFTAGDSREPELAGIWGAAVGSFWTMLVTFCLAFPIGVMAAIYLEEFAPRTKITDFIEVNINNLAAVPSIVFGLLGLAIFVAGIEVFGIEIGGFVPRSAPLAGGIVLALMTLPTIIIASRAAIRAVPPSIRDAALGVGASKLQTSFHHVLPLAMPGILTGTIIGMAQALGETAPLIMIGMVAFIVDVPTGVADSATVLPVQVFRWSDFPERAFEARTAAAICVLLFFLVAMNALAVFLRKRFERRW